MKKLLLVAAVAVTLNVQARTMEDCAINAQASKIVMQARQAGISIDEVMPGYSDDPETEASFVIMRLMTIDAFSQPGYSLSKNQDRASVEFQSKWTLKCLKGK